MRRSFLYLTTFLFSLAFARADVVRVQSPDTAQTYSFGTILWRQLRWIPARQALVASITFSNVDYVSRVEPRHDERFDFALPGVQCERATGVFFVRAKSGAKLRVAAIHRQIIGTNIELLPTSEIATVTNSGRVTVVLTASSEPLVGERWTQAASMGSLLDSATAVARLR